VKPRRWTLVLIIGAWTMTLGFLIRIIWGIGDNVDSIPVYAIQNLVRLVKLLSAPFPPCSPAELEFGLTVMSCLALVVPPPIPLRLPSIQLHGPPPPSNLSRRRGLPFLTIEVDREDLCHGGRGHLLDASERGWDGGYWRGQSRDWGSCESAVCLDPGEEVWF
jgi:hypothetical protein